MSECLAVSGIAHTVCVATEYGETMLKEHPYMKVHRGRMDREEIRTFLQNGSFEAVVDATHPYADLITDNIRMAMQGMKLPYLRLRREESADSTYEGVIRFQTNEACAGALEKTEGNILLTTGSKELSKYCSVEEVRNRLYVRVLPGTESLSLCMEQGITGKQIIAMQGPFTAEMNEAVIHQYGISVLVTKESGSSGGYAEKLEAAQKAGIPVFVIGHPQEAGYSFGELCRRLEKLCGQRIRAEGTFRILLAGVGMGHPDSLTCEVRDAIAQADILLGAERMLKPYKPRLEKQPYYQAEQILPYLKKMQEAGLGNRTVVILFSGDSGFYSGCQRLYHALREEADNGRLNASIRILPGISSVAHLAASIGESYQDAAIYSMHGKEVKNLARRIQREEKTYLLMSGVRDVNRLGQILTEARMTECEVVAGYQMSYREQQIRRLTPEECAALQEEGLYTCLVRNPAVGPKRLTHGIPDREFIRNRVPMTKEEVREVSICKLRLHEGAVVCDIGSGTGSIAVELACLSDAIQVYAIERNREAVSLIEQNKKALQLENITILEAEAPEGLSGLPKPTHAFIGGSGGRLKDILRTLYHMNPDMRVVMNAISMETICEMKEILSLYPVKNEEIVQIQVSRSKKAGFYHLMQAENPVWICAFDFCPSVWETYMENEYEIKTNYDCCTEKRKR